MLLNDAYSTASGGKFLHFCVDLIRLMFPVFLRTNSPCTNKINFHKFNDSSNHSVFQRWHAISVRQLLISMRCCNVRNTLWIRIIPCPWRIVIYYLCACASRLHINKTWRCIVFVARGNSNFGSFCAPIRRQYSNQIQVISHIPWPRSVIATKLLMRKGANKYTILIVVVWL